MVSSKLTSFIRHVPPMSDSSPSVCDDSICESDDLAQNRFGPNRLFLQSLKFGLRALAWADLIISAMDAAKLHGPNRLSCL